MLEITLLVVSLGIADSINPFTIAIAIYLASTPHPRRRLAGYASGVFSVYLAGGVILVAGPGDLLRTGAARTDTHAFHVASVLIGSLVIALAIILWLRRERWRHMELPSWALRTESSFALGAAVTALDLPTAFPYFGAIGAIASSGLALPSQLLLLVVFNVLYVLPLVAILIAYSLRGERVQAVLVRVSDTVARVSPIVLTALTLGAGVALVIRGARRLLGG